MNHEENLISVFRYVVPELILVAGACVLFLGATVRASRTLWGVLALLTLGAAGAALYLTPSPDAAAVGPLRYDALAVLVKTIALAGTAVLVLCSWGEVPERGSAEYFACLLLVASGVGLVGMANELVTLFLALELVSIPTYIILYLPRPDATGQEAAAKYFLLSVFSSAILLFGFSYLYGLGGTTNLGAILQAFHEPPAERPPAMTYVALVMVVAGLGFRITAVPFHFYAPDVYQGASSAGAALLAFIPKVAGFAALFRVLGYLWPHHERVGLALGQQVPIFMWILAAGTMALGNLLALLQDNLKRMLAYSSVAHAGYMLIGLAVAPSAAGLADAREAISAVLFYLIAYGAMTIGAFGILAYLNSGRRPVEEVDDLAGLSRSHPGLALLMGLFLLSLIGMPLTAGFVGKFLLFLGALGVQDDRLAYLYRILALVGALNAAVGGWYYLRILAVMYLRNSLRPLEPVRSWPGLATLWLCAGVTLAGGLYPELILRATRVVLP